MSAVAEDISCQELVELVTEYLEGTLPADKRARFEEHLTSCADCTAYVAQIRATIELTGRLAPEEISPEALESLLGAFRDWPS